ncbi:hypothetical protein ACIOHA_15735 [Streptomyces anulatus]
MSNSWIDRDPIAGQKCPRCSAQLYARTRVIPNGQSLYPVRRRLSDWCDRCEEEVLTEE